jgi:serpin B
MKRDTPTWVLLALILLAVLPLNRCEAQDRGRSVPAQLNPDEKAVVTATDTFAANLYGHLAPQPGNLFLSPYSIATTLGMAYAGARGQTAEQMASTLHFTLDRDKLLDAFRGLTRHLNAAGRSRKYELHVANALWGQKGYPFHEQYLRTTMHAFGAGLREADFAHSSEEARQTINRWVEDETRKKIMDLLPPGSVNATTRLVLTNAIYFKAAWSQPFSKKGTKQQQFHVSASESLPVPMMHDSKELLYFEDRDFQLLALPYQNNELSMLVLLPRKIEEIGNIEKRLTGEQLEQWRSSQRLYEVDLALPKFKFTSRFGLKETFSAMGMPLASSPGAADFSGMCSPEKLWIDEVIHNAFVDVNEEGTEAAAATAAVMVTAALQRPPKPRATFRADHPFIFVIRDNQTGAILFMGRVSNPKS